MTESGSIRKSEGRLSTEIKYFVWYLFVGLSSVFISVAVDHERWWDSVKYLGIDPMGIGRIFIQNYFPAFITAYVFLTAMKYVFLWAVGRFWQNQKAPSSE